jgi:hypothetical protein
MTTDKLRKASALAGIAVAVAGVAAFVGVAPAAAAPGNCDQWGFSGPTNVKLSTGPLLSFHAEESATVKDEFATDGRQDNGRIEGAIAPNGFLGLTYTSETFKDDPPLILRGDVTPDGGASGTFNAKNSGTWQLATPLKCLTTASSQAGTGNSREVTGDVDAYDAPGGTGNKIGVLEGGDGQRVNLGSGCRDDNWCNVAFAGGPGGTAWVWGDFLK